MATLQTQITVRGFAHSDALERAINEHASWLGQFHSRLARVRILVTLPHRHHRDGRRFHVRIEMKVPGSAPLVVRSATSLDAHLAVHHAFDVARRRLEDFARERRGDVKTHVMLPAVG